MKGRDMSSLELFDALVGAPTWDAGLARRVLLHAEPELAELPLEALGELCDRLPSGLMQAEAVCAVPAAPEGLAPLAQGSRWYASGRTLLVVANGGALTALARDLTHYAWIATQVAEALGPTPELVQALVDDGCAADVRSRSALALGVSPEAFENLLGLHPGLTDDLAAM